MRIFCELRCIFPSLAGGRKNTSNEQNVRSYYMLNHRIRGLLFHYKKKLIFYNWLLFVLVRVFRNILIPSVKIRLTMNNMFAGIICHTIEREVDYSTTKKIVILAYIFTVNLFSIVKISFIPHFPQVSHNCSFIRRYSPCCKPVKLGH